MEDQSDRETALIGAVLFLENEPADESRLSRLSGLAIEQVQSALTRLQVEYDNPVHGFAPLRSGGGWILAPKVDLWEALKDTYGRKNEARLSRAAMETLSIVAYSQPVTRAEIEGIRGVSADGMIRFLLEKGFVQEVGRKDTPGRPVQFGTTRAFLMHFRLGSIADLPSLDPMELERFGSGEDEQG
jgi:segregation and condensation protein B